MKQYNTPILNIHKINTHNTYKKTIQYPISYTNISNITPISTTISNCIASNDITTKLHNKTIENWYWPTKGKIINDFSIKNGNQGVDIAGTRGQPIIATANGKVVYAGNALRGYGNLIIIKHNDDYLSAYAHNDILLVKEQQEIIAGQQIATMGSTGTNITKLHFEIRYKGKSVNPIHYLSHQ